MKSNLEQKYFIMKPFSPGAESEIFKKWGTLRRPAWLAGEENFRFQMVQSGRRNVRNYKFLEKIFLSSFANFLHFCQ